MNSYQQSLEKLGYNLQDCGSHWRSRAIYRNGKTNTSLIIYKDSGVWKDFGLDNQAKPFTALVKETLKTEDFKVLKQYYPDTQETYIANKPKEEKTQKIFQCGYAGGGKMYRRIVFPIYDLDNQIHGFSGRTVIEGDNIPKWKHMGRKTNWVYPNHLAHEYIDKSGEVILVESIGDCMALYEAGFKNVLMLAGLDISNKMISYLNAFNLERIIISTNNDKTKEVNSGALASVKIASKLSTVFDLSLIKVNPPVNNDFGEMLERDTGMLNNFKQWYQRKDKWCMGDQKFQEYILKQINQNDQLKKNVHCKKFCYFKILEVIIFH